jgi:hypothetical protein
MSYFSHSWLPYIYQYGLGAVIFIVGIVITLKSGSFIPRFRLHRKWMSILILGFVWYMTLHGSLTLAALGHERMAILVAAVVMPLSIAATLLLNRRLRGGG